MARSSPKAKSATPEPEPQAEPKAKAAKAASKPKPATSAKSPAKAKPTGKAAKKAAKPMPKPPAGAKSPPAEAFQEEAPFEPFEPKRKSLSERFWHRLGVRAQKAEAKAHERETELEFREQQAENQRIAAEREAKRRHDAEERRKAAISARELKRAAVEEERRMQVEAIEARRAAREAKAREEREAKEAKAREAREAKEARVRAAREAKEAKAAAARQAEEDRRAAEQAAREQAAREAEEQRLREEHEREVAAAEAIAATEREERARRKAEEEAAKEAEKAERAARKAEEAERAEQERAERAARKAAEKAAAEAQKAAEKAAAEAQKAAEAERKAEEEAAAALELERRAAAKAAEPAPRKGTKKVVVADALGEPTDEDVADEPEPAVSLRERKEPERSEPQTDLERQADSVAAELLRRRSKPVTIDVEDEAVPTLPVGRKAHGDEEPAEDLQLEPAPPARIPEMAAPKGLSIPEHYMLLAMEGTWDERIEKAKAGALGGGLTGALLLELVMQGAVKVQRDRFVLENADLDAADEAVARKLEQYDRLPSLQAMSELAKWLPQLLPAYKDRMMARGLIEHRQWRHLGIFYRSQTALLDQDAQERLRNKLARAIAGGGRPDAPTILSLGLLEATGLFGVVVPEGAQAYNRKRLNGLLAGKDVMGYKVDDQLKGIQEIAVRTILDNVRVMTVRG